VNGQTASYAYDGAGRRVKKVVNGTSSVTTIFVYNAAGQLIAEYTSDPVPPPAGGGGTSYLTSDHLGSTRVVTKQAGSVKARYDYLPFGEELGATIGQRTLGMGYGAPDSTRQKFTQKERDSESGLDYFLARYYSSAQGRFTSPDEFVGGPDELFEFADQASSNPTVYAEVTNPQSLNKYQYCYNNPLNFADPDGHQGQVLVERLLSNPTVQQNLDKATAIAAAGATVAWAATSGAAKKLWNGIVGAIEQSGAGICNDPCTAQNVLDNLHLKQSEEQKTEAQGQQQSADGQSNNYQPNPKHNEPKGDDRRGVSPQPKAGGSLYDSAVEVKAGQRVNVDRSTGKFVVYRTDQNGQTHGYETTWKGLRNEQRAALQKAGVVTQRGKIIPTKEGQQ
jgi:RHS repeat-associated protein